MPALTDARQEAFCREYVAKAKEPGKTDVDCFRAAGFIAKTQRSAEVGASRLLSYDEIKKRIAELQATVADAVVKAVIDELRITTVDVARKMWGLADFDISTIMNVVTETVGRGRSAKAVQRFVIKDTALWPKEALRLVQGFRIGADGTILAVLGDRRQAAKLVGEHLGMFQGETGNLGGTPPRGDTINNTVNVYVDKPPPETFDQWAARIERQRGIKQIEHSGNGVAKNGAGNGKA